jgi:ankyrin repeat protein
MKNAPNIKVNLYDKNKATPLLIAAWNDHTEVVKLLLARKDIKVNLYDKNKATPLFWAAASGHTKVVKLLLEHKDINVNPCDEDGYTPLWIAAAYGHVKMVKRLLDHKDIDVNLCNKGGNTPLFRAAARGHTKIVELFAQYFYDNRGDVIQRDDLRHQIVELLAEDICYEADKNLFIRLNSILYPEKEIELKQNEPNLLEFYHEKKHLTINDFSSVGKALLVEILKDLDKLDFLWKFEKLIQKLELLLSAPSVLPSSVFGWFAQQLSQPQEKKIDDQYLRSILSQIKIRLPNMDMIQADGKKPKTNGLRRRHYINDMSL